MARWHQGKGEPVPLLTYLLARCWFPLTDETHLPTHSVHYIPRLSVGLALIPPPFFEQQLSLKKHQQGSSTNQGCCPSQLSLLLSAILPMISCLYPRLPAHTFPMFLELFFLVVNPSPVANVPYSLPPPPPRLDWQINLIVAVSIALMI